MLKLIISEKSCQLAKFFEYLDWSNKQQEPTYLLCFNDVKIRAKYNELLQLLGTPSMIKPHHKTYSEWVFTIIDESRQIVFLTLYDYKDAYYYGYDENQIKDELIEWHFGSTLSQVNLAKQICDEINSELKELRTNTPNNSAIKSTDPLENLKYFQEKAMYLYEMCQKLLCKNTLNISTTARMDEIKADIERIGSEMADKIKSITKKLVDE